MNRGQPITGLAAQTFQHSPDSRDSEHLHALSLTVLFTNVIGTLTALRRAAQLAYQLRARIRVLVPYIVPYPLPLDKPRVDPDFRLRHFRTMCEHEPIETTLDVRLCRDTKECLRDALASQSLIVIGGKRSWWPFSMERRVARQLTRAGHQVVFVASREAE